MDRVIFVEGERRGLTSRYARLAPRCSEWGPQFVSEPDDVMGALRETTPGAVVMDLGGLGDAGLDLLRHLHHAHPGSASLVLAGRADPVLIQRALPLAHHCVAGPIDFEDLERLIGRMLEMGRRLTDPRIEALARGGEALPPTPLYSRLTRVIRDEGTSVRQLTPIVVGDLAIVDRMLELVNSSFGLSTPVTDPREAIAILGPTTLQALVLNLEVFRALDETSCAGLEVDELRTHGLGAADIASRLLRGTNVWNQARVAGLLHDVGRLVFSAANPEEYSSLIARVRDTGQSLASVEYGTYGFTHADLGAYAARHWGLPWTIVEPIALHHDASPAWFDDAFDARHAVYVAEVLLDEGTSLEAASIDELAVQLAAHGLAEEVADWRDEAAEEPESRRGPDDSDTVEELFRNAG